MYSEYFNDILNTLNESFNGMEDYLSLNENNEENLNNSSGQFSVLNLDLQENQNILHFVTAFFPEFFPLLKILDILNLSKNEELKNRIESVFTQNKEFINENKEYSIENTNEYNYMRFLGKKRVEVGDIIESKCLYEQNLNKKNNRGRKNDNTEYNNERERHDKYKADNIIKKLKGKFFKYGIKFLNKIIGLNKEDGLLNFKKYINNLKRDVNLEYLNMKLWELYSKDISLKNIKKDTYNMIINNEDDKIKNKDIDYNKNILKKQINKDDATLDFALNMTFRNFIDLFTGKKKVEDLVVDNKRIDYSKIQSSIEGKDEMLMEMKIDINNKLDKIYFQKYIFYMYNYERWFYIKNPKTKGNVSLKEPNSSTNFFSI